MPPPTGVRPSRVAPPLRAPAPPAAPLPPPTPTLTLPDPPLSSPSSQGPFGRAGAKSPGGGLAAPAGSGGGKNFVEALKYKTLRVGMKLLGVITEVTERGMQISLPNGLKGTVTRAEASEPFAGKGANRRGGDGDDDEISASDASSSDSDSDSDDDADPLSLTEAFEIGQVIRCVVRRLDKGKSGGKRIDLATRLDAVCAGRASDALREGVNVPATVESVEDHGFVLSFGGGANGPRGFLPRKSAGKRALVRGSVLDVVLTGEKKDAGAVVKSRVLHATADPKRVASVVTHESDGTVMSTLLPGMLVNARVRSVLSDGVSVNFMTYFVATAETVHVGDAKGSGAIPDAAAPDPNDAHKPGERCRARVLYVDAASKRVGLTLRPRLLRLGLGDAEEDAAATITPGAVYEDAVFVASIPPWASSSNSPETPRRARAWDTATSATPPTIAWINSSVDFASVRRFARASSDAARLTASPS